MDKLPLYEALRDQAGVQSEPRAWLDGDGRITPEGPHPKIMFGDVPVMMHLTNGHSIAPLRDECEFADQPMPVDVTPPTTTAENIR